jgi:hypothetical protein
MSLKPKLDSLPARLWIVAALTLLGTWAVNREALAAPRSKFVLSSPDKQLTVSVPEKYTLNTFGCTGINLSPPLRWSGAPAGTKSFVLTLFDPDERSTPSGWWHWIVYDLPPNVSELPEGAGVEHGKLLPAPALEGRSDIGQDAYHGPCPDKGDPPHHYTFTIYALNVAKLDVPADSSGAMVTSMSKQHVLAKAVLIAHYGRP